MVMNAVDRIEELERQLAESQAKLERSESDRHGWRTAAEHQGERLEAERDARLQAEAEAAVLREAIRNAAGQLVHGERWRVNTAEDILKSALSAAPERAKRRLLLDVVERASVDMWADRDAQDTLRDALDALDALDGINKENETP